MTENYIRFKKQRDLGEIITDTFKFLRENYKPLLKLIFKIAGPAFLVLLVALAYTSYLSMDTMGNSMFDLAAGIDIGTFIISAVVMLFALLAFYVLLYGTVLHYIFSYVKNDGTVIEEEVTHGAKYDFGNLLGLIVLSGIITIFGTALCFLPGIYVYVPLSIAPAILVIHRTSVTDAISDSFSLITDNWWMTFFTLLVMGILVYIISLIFQIPLIIYYFIKTFTIVQEGSAADPTTLFDWVYIILNVISSLFQYLLTTIMIITAAFIYYDLNEKKNFTGTYETISQIGSSETK